VTEAPRTAPDKQRGRNMTDDQVKRIVEHLCQHLHVAVRLKGTQPEIHPPNLKDLGFDPASVRAVLLTGLHWAGITVVDQDRDR
jgi:hypothetical protein